jgi:hypothetical protein
MTKPCFPGVVPAVLAAALVWASAAQGQSIGINFGATSTNGPGAPNTPMDPSETAGAIVVQANWNSIPGQNGGIFDPTNPAVNLVDDQSNATGAVLAYWSSTNDWTLNLNGDVMNDAHMMKGYLDTTSTSTTEIVIIGIPYNNYDVYIYSSGQNDTGTTDRQGLFAVNDPAFLNPQAALNPAGEIFGITTTTYTEGQEYVVFPSQSGATLLVTATPDPNFGSPPNFGFRAPLNAIQIVSRD